MKWINIFAGLIFLFSCDAQSAEDQRCSYDTYQWNTKIKQAVNRERVVKSYSQLGEEEIDEMTGCSVCEQDQVVIELPHVKPFRVCHVIAEQVENVLHNAVGRGYSINEVVGYRNGKTRGPVDSEGNRTGFSNHSFGIAIDINPNDNGLYDRCIEWGSACRLIRGGAWQPGKKAGSLTKESYIVVEFEKAGLLWGGEIEGKQKDFMHFSPTGY